jgi:hypothetical protein
MDVNKYDVCADWIDLAQDTDQWRSVVNTVQQTYGFLQGHGTYVSSRWATSNFLRRTPFRSWLYLKADLGVDKDVIKMDFKT